MGVLAMALLNSGDIGTRPRFIAAAFPLFLGVATVFGPRLLRMTVAVSAFLLFATTGLYMGGMTVPRSERTARLMGLCPRRLIGLLRGDIRRLYIIHGLATLPLVYLHIGKAMHYGRHREI